MSVPQQSGRGRKKRSDGMAYVLSLIMLALFASLAVAFAVTTDTSVQKADNHELAQAAMFAAESGMEFAMSKMVGIASEEDNPDMAALTAQVLSNALNGTANIDCGDVSYDPEAGLITVPPILLPTGDQFSFTVTRLDASRLRLHVTGQAGGISRTLSVDYTLHEDRSVLTYSVASRSRVLITDGAVVGGDITSTWDRTRIGSYDVPPFLTEPDTRVDGHLKTVLSQADYEMHDSQDYVEGEHEGFAYDEPRFADYTADDFDTSSYKAGTTDITSIGPPTSYDHDSWFPSSDNKRRKLDRPIYENMTFDNIYVPPGHNPKFVNCTFNRIIYLDTDETTTLGQWSHDYYDQHAIPGREYRSDDRYNDHSNNVVFDGCTFNGPVITGVPRDYWWSKNALTFEGETTFTNSYMPESTIMAPNFGVDIGGRGYDGESNPDSKMTGIIIGGIVDVRGTANIEGTILSMYYPDTDLGTGASYYGTNIGFYADGGETAGASGIEGDIRIVPQPDNVLPFGMRRKYKLAPSPNTYLEHK